VSTAGDSAVPRPCSAPDRPAALAQGRRATARVTAMTRHGHTSILAALRPHAWSPRPSFVAHAKPDGHSPSRSLPAPALAVVSLRARAASWPAPLLRLWLGPPDLASRRESDGPLPDPQIAPGAKFD